MQNISSVLGTVEDLTSRLMAQPQPSSIHQLTWNDSEDLSTNSSEGVGDALAENASEGSLLEWRELVDDDSTDLC